MFKPLNMLFFLFGLSLAFVPFAHADCTSITKSFSSSATSTQPVRIETNGATVTFYAKYWSNSQGYVEFVIGTRSDGLTYTYHYDHYTYSSSKFYLYYIGETSECFVPDPCEDGEMSEGEGGIDCGGSCSAECVDFCAEGQELRIGPEGFKTCAYITQVDNFGNCTPCQGSLYLHKSGSECQCVSFGDYVSAFAGYVPPASSSPAPDEFTNGTFSVVQSSEVVVDNGDGSETATITTIKTNLDGSTSTGSTSVSRPSGSATGTGFSSSSSVGVGVEAGYEGEEEGETGSEAVAGSTSAPDSLDFGGVLGEQLTIAQGNIESFIDDFENIGIVQTMNSVFTLPADTITNDTLSLNCGSYGVHEFSIGSSSIFDILGGVLQVGAFITGIYIIFRKV